MEGAHSFICMCVWRECGRGRQGKGAVGRTEVLGSEGGKRNRGQWKQRSVRPRGQAAWCPQSPGWRCCRANGPTCIITGVFCPRVKDRIYHGVADIWTIDHVLWKSERSLRSSFELAGTSGRLTLCLPALRIAEPFWPRTAASTISLMGQYKTSFRGGINESPSQKPMGCNQYKSVLRVFGRLPTADCFQLDRKWNKPGSLNILPSGHRAPRTPQIHRSPCELLSEVRLEDVFHTLSDVIRSLLFA